MVTTVLQTGNASPVTMEGPHKLTGGGPPYLEKMDGMGGGLEGGREEGKGDKTSFCHTWAFISNHID